MPASDNNRHHNTQSGFNFRQYSKRHLLLSLSISIILLAVAIFAFVPRSSALTNNGSITAFGAPLTESFDTLASSGSPSWTDNSTIPGWYAQFGTNATNPTAYTPSTGSSATGALYSFGSTSAIDRALGSVGSGTTTDIFWAVKLTNNTGATITSLSVSYTGEEWRAGGCTPTPCTPAAQTVDFQYQIASAGVITDANNPNTGWLDHDPLDFTSPQTGTSTATALDGNSAANRTAFSSTISVTINPGQEVWLRWKDINHANNDHGLAIDNFSVTANGAGPTNPTGVGAANPSSVLAGATTLLTVAVTPGTSPISTAHTVSADLTAIGGSASQAFFDDGTNGDVTAGDNTFSFNATVSNSTTAGGKTLPVTIQETSPLSRTGNASISLTVLVPTPPTGTGAANPNPVQAGNATLLTVNVTPGANPTSTGIAVTGDLSSIGGSGTQQFYDDGTHGDVLSGNNIFSFNATVAPATPVGLKSLPIQITDAQSRTGNTSISLSVQAAPPPAGSVVISQLYGGGGNSGATLKNDFIEIFNRSTNPIDLTGWSVQYTSAAGTSWQKTALVGFVLQPGQYYLVQEGAGAGGTVDLPTPDAIGTIAMSATQAKVALVRDNNNLSGACPLADPELMDFVGYGNASCFEGAGAAPGLDNVTADFRSHLGCKDTDSNGGNFFSGSPNPRNSATTATVCPVGDFEPEIFATSPTNNETHVPVDGNITINFDEPVNVTGNWFQISCTSGMHTATVSGGPTSFTLNPDTDFGFNEPCTVTVFASQVTDQDFIDPPDNLAADYVFSFNSEFFRDPAEHMVMGNPSNATTNVADSTNFLMMKIQYALSYNDSRGTPNWTSWHLDSTWRGSAPRVDLFRADETLPPGYHQVQGGGVPGEVNDYSGSGFDRGHMCPSADRTSTPTDNAATFFMTNMIPQGPGNNQGPWAALENSLRTFLPASELYIISGGQGIGGIGSNGPASTIAGGFVTVPAKTWKAGLILPVGDNDVSRVDTNTRIIAVIMPNDDAIRFDQWQKYLATVDQIEALTGYDLYSNVPTAIQDVIEARVDAANDTAPVTVDQTKTVAEDGSVGVTLTATDFNVNNVFTYTIVDQPLHGSVLCTAANCTYSPAAHYFGPDSFTFKANDSALDSNVSTVNITVTEVNNDPSAVNDNKQTAEDSSLNFAAGDLTSNDSAGPGEGAQTLTVDSIISTPNTHGSINLSASQITYNPDTNYNGPASFDYHVCDDGTTNGAPDSKCTTGTVNVTVTEVNDTPSAANDSKTTNEDTQLSFAASDLTGNDSAGPANESSQTLTVSSVTATVNTHGTVSLSSGQVIYTPAGNYNGPASFEYGVCDNGTTASTPDSKCATGTVNVTVSPVNDPPVANNDSYATNSNATLNVPATGVLGNDTDIDSGALSAVIVSTVSHGTLTLNPDGSFSYTPAIDYTGSDSFSYRANDGAANSNVATVTLTVNDTVGPYLNSSVAISLIATTNSDLINVGLAASATDNSGGAVTIQVAVFGDEDDQTPTVKNTLHSPDAKDIAPVTLRLRGERVEANDGRVYLIIVIATDSSGNISRNYQTVVVPKNNKQASIDSVNAQAAAAISYAQAHAGAPPPGYFVIGDGPIIGPKQ